ncbi:MAG: NepR family anti-sigma factor [Methylovirgula sp.]
MTKPIDLRAKKTGGPLRRQKAQGTDVKEASAPKEARSPTRTSTLTGARARKAPKPEIIEQVGLRLRGVYNDVLMQPIPDRFLDLLRKLEAGARAKPPQTARDIGSKKDPR